MLFALHCMQWYSIVILKPMTSGFLQKLKLKSVSLYAVVGFFVLVDSKLTKDKLLSCWYLSNRTEICFIIYVDSVWFMFFITDIICSWLSCKTMSSTHQFQVSDPNFCTSCGSVLPIPTLSSTKVVCKKCQHAVDIAGNIYDGIMLRGCWSLVIFYV